MKKILGFISLLLLASCTTTSSVGLYGGSVPTKKVSGSYGQAKRTFTVNFDVQDTRAAVKRAFGMEGLDFDVQKGNMMSGAGVWQDRFSSCSCTYAVYIQEINKSPKTRVVFVADYETFTGSMFAKSSVSTFLSKVAGDFNAVIASYN